MDQTVLGELFFILMCLTFTYMPTSLCIYLLKLVKGTIFCILHMLYILSLQQIVKKTVFNRCLIFCDIYISFRIIFIFVRIRYLACYFCVVNSVFILTHNQAKQRTKYSFCYLNIHKSRVLYLIFFISFYSHVSLRSAFCFSQIM
jgi:hypothetical protein